MKYYVTGRSMYELEEIEEEFEDLISAQIFAGKIVDEGGHAEVTDENGNEYPNYPW